MAPNNLFVAIVFFNLLPVANLTVCRLQVCERWIRETETFMLYTYTVSVSSLSLPSADVAFVWETRNNVAILCIQA